MAWLGIIIIIFYLNGYTIYHVWIHFIPTSSYQRKEEKHLVCARIKPRSSCFPSNSSNHQTMAPRARFNLKTANKSQGRLLIFEKHVLTHLAVVSNLKLETHPILFQPFFCSVRKWYLVHFRLD